MQIKRLPLFMLVGGTYGSALTFGNSYTFNPQASDQSRQKSCLQFALPAGAPCHGSRPWQMRRC